MIRRQSTELRGTCKPINVDLQKVIHFQTLPKWSVQILDRSKYKYECLSFNSESLDL